MILLLTGLLNYFGIISIDKDEVLGFFWHYKITLGLLATVAVTLYAYTKWQLGYFKRRGIESCDDAKPVFGHMFNVLAKKENFLDLVAKTYSSFPGEKYVGQMQMNRPLIVLRDLELIKRAGVKEFDHFVDHFVTLSEDTDSIFGNHLFALKGDKWRDMRATLSPAFTSSKMRGMFEFVSETGEQMVKYFQQKLKEPDNRERGLVEFEMKDAFARYANDVIATSAFGVKVDSLGERDNDFYKMGLASTNFSGIQLIKFFLFASFPSVMKLTRISVIDENIKDFFRNLVLDGMKKRQAAGIVRQDMLHLLHEAQKGFLKHETQHKASEKEAGFATVDESQVGKQTVKRNWTDDDMVAQAILFFIAGFDSVSTMLCFMGHELAVNVDVQKKLQEEVDEIVKENGKHLEYNHLSKMPYMDMVVSETLRKWPPAPATDRRCIKPFALPPSSSGKAGYTVTPGEGIWIPIYALHRDKQYFPDPDRFDPERFSDENKANIDPMSYLPFGVGPRNCIGSRFALMEIKAVMFHLLASFNIVPTARTEHPLRLAKSSFALKPEKGFWIGLEPRK